MVSVEGSGKKEEDPRVREVRFTFRGEELSIRGRGEEGEPRYRVRLDAAKAPKWIDLTALNGPDKGKQLTGIYSLEGGRLLLCAPEVNREGAARPREFKTGEGDGLVLIVLERVKKEKGGGEAPPKGQGEAGPGERAAADNLDALLRAMDGFRTKLPPPQGIGEMNGAGTADADGEVHPDSHLWGIATRLGVKTRAECLVLLTYLKDPRVKVRHIAAFALEGLVRAYPNGFPAGALDRVDSDQHRDMVRAFVVGIEKLNR
jgi:uncharacterized protein (TIGR03067 family)